MSLAASSTLVIAAFALALASSGHAIHLYRGDGGGCSAAAGDLTDDPGPSGQASASVLMAHTSFHDTKNGAGVSIITRGDSVTWLWSSEHCHSVRAETFYSGFHYPAAGPVTPPAPAPLDGAVAYPVPTQAPTLGYTHTFAEPGTYFYDCEHHGEIGMVGVVVVLG